MSSPAPQSDLPSPDPISPDNALPEVEPPNALFILQLFVVPGVIVLMIVAVWAAFSWMARGADDPSILVQKIRIPNDATSFQYAKQLADALRNPRHEAFKRNSDAAGALAEFLNEEIDAGSAADKPIAMRVFLCRALGEFQVDEGLDVLLRAATTQRSDAEVAVRQSAIEAIAVRAEYASHGDARQALDHPDLYDTLLTASEDKEDLIRSTTAYAMGYLATDNLLAKLETMVDDPYPDARYNAALSLARNGRTKAIEVLEEMLDVEERAGIDIELEESARDYKRAKIIINALRASRLLAEKNREADLSRLVAALETLIQTNQPRPIIIEATDTLIVLKKRAEPAITP